MTFDIYVRSGDGPDVRITTKHSRLSFSSTEGEHGLTLEADVAWCAEQLKSEPYEYIAVSSAWPGNSTLTVANTNSGEPVFSGDVTGIGWKDGYLSLTAVDPADAPPDPFTVTVDADPADPNRLTAGILVDNSGHGDVTVDFGDGSATETNPGDGSTLTSHVYSGEGTFTLSVTDADEPDRSSSQDVAVPFPEA